MEVGHKPACSTHGVPPPIRWSYATDPTATEGRESWTARRIGRSSRPPSPRGRTARATFSSSSPMTPAGPSPGTSPVSGTYTSRQQLLDLVIAPLKARLADWIRPTVDSIVAEDDRVAVLWHGHATARDGRPYDNTYSWHLRFIAGAVVEATAFI